MLADFSGQVSWPGTILKRAEDERPSGLFLSMNSLMRCRLRLIESKGGEWQEEMRRHGVTTISSRWTLRPS